MEIHSLTKMVSCKTHHHDLSSILKKLCFESENTLLIYLGHATVKGEWLFQSGDHFEVLDFIKAIKGFKGIMMQFSCGAK